MSKRYILSIIVILISVILPQAACLAQSTQQLSQFGITWTFDRAYRYGQFANGDYWVVGPVRIIGIDPPSHESNGRMMNGSMINPSPRYYTRQGYDSELYGSYPQAGEYDPLLNAARPNGQPVSSGNLLIVPAGSSLVSVISHPDPPSGSYIQSGAILTVLSAPPPEGSFRPPYVNVPKAIRFNKSQLNYSLLKKLSVSPSVSSVMPRLTQQAGDGQEDSVERMFERPWIDHIPLWMGRAHHPMENMPDYAREMSTQVGIGALMLHLDFSNQEKETLLIRYVQLGIDLYGIVRDGGGGNWIGMGGHASARKYPILFAGLVLGDADMRNIGQKSGDYIHSGSYGPGDPPPDYIHFGEDDQTFYVTQADVDITNGPLFYPDQRDAEKLPYRQTDIGLPEWGIVHAVNPEQSNRYWPTWYRQVTGTGWAGWVLAVHIMGVKDLWNHDALFDYMDRYMQVAEDDGAWPGYRQQSRFSAAMWDTCREQYGRRWIMNNYSDPYSQGHYTGSGPTPPIVFILGDVSGNGDVSTYDATLAAQYSVGLIYLDGQSVQRADVTANSKVSSYDASLIAQYAIGLIEGF